MVLTITQEIDRDLRKDFKDISWICLFVAFDVMDDDYLLSELEKDAVSGLSHWCLLHDHYQRIQMSDKSWFVERGDHFLHGPFCWKLEVEICETQRMKNE